MRKVTMKDLIREISDECGFTYKDTDGVIRLFVKKIIECIKNSDEVYLYDLGRFCVKKQSGREVKNPITGENVKIGNRKYVRFKVSPKLRTSLLKQE